MRLREARTSAAWHYTSSFVQPHDLGLGQRVEVEIEADNRRRRVGLHVELVRLYGEHGEQITVRVGPWRRARTAVAGRTEIGAGRQRARWQLAAARASTFGQLSDVGWDVDDEPVPKAGAGRRIRIVAGDGKTFRSLRRVRPLEMRRLVAAGAAEAERGVEDEIVLEIIAVFETVA